MARLVLESGDEKGQVFELKPATVIGRLASCDIPIKDRKSSRNNTKIFAESGTFFVEDLNSSNGTFLNDKKISKAVLRHGDRVTIGTTTLRFEAGPAAPARAGAEAGPGQPQKQQPKPPEAAKRPPSGAMPAAPAGHRPASAVRPEPPAAGLPAGPGAREKLAAAETPPAGLPSPAAPPAAPASAVSAADRRAKIASLETPPAGIPAPVGAGGAVPKAEEEVEEIDLGGDEAAPEVELPKPPAAAAAPEKPKVQLQFRVPIRSEAKGRDRNLLFQDVSQRSAGFRIAVYAVAVGIMALLGYLAFRLASGAL